MKALVSDVTYPLPAPVLTNEITELPAPAGIAPSSRTLPEPPSVSVLAPSLGAVQSLVIVSCWPLVAELIVAPPVAPPRANARFVDSVPLPVQVNVPEVAALPRVIVPPEPRTPFEPLLPTADDVSRPRWTFRPPEKLLPALVSWSVPLASVTAPEPLMSVPTLPPWLSVRAKTSEPPEPTAMPLVEAIEPAVPPLPICSEPPLMAVAPE